MPIKDWSTTYPTTQDADPITGTQPDLVNESAPGAGDGDDMRVSQMHALRDKLHAVAKIVGDNGSLPAGSLLERMTTVEAALSAGATFVVPAALNGGKGALNAATGQLDFGVADDFPGVALDPSWTVSLDVGGAATVTGGYLELVAGETVPTYVQRTVVPGTPFEMWCHVEIVSPSNGDTAGIHLQDAATFPGSRWCQAANSRNGSGTVEYLAKTHNITNALTGTGSNTSQWLLLRYTGLYLVWGYSTAADTSEPDLANGWTYRHNQVWTGDAFSPRRLSLFVDPTGGDNQTTARFRHLRFRYL